MRHLILMILTFALFAIRPSMAHADALKDVTPLKETEMSQLCGGFSLNGLNLNVGIDNLVSLNGNTIATSNITLNGNTVSTSTTGNVSVVGANGGTTNVQMPNMTTTIITNTSNNVTLNQTRTISVDMTNLTRQALMSMKGMQAIQSAAMYNMKMGLH